MTFKDIFPGLSPTKVIFKNFPGPGIFKKKSRTFQEAWKPCITQVSHSLQAHTSGREIHVLRASRCQKVFQSSCKTYSTPLVQSYCI